VTASYTTSPPYGDFSGPEFETDDLLAHFDFYSRERARLLLLPSTDVTEPSIAFAEWRQDEILAELEWRKHIAKATKHDSRGPKSPRRSQRQKDLLELARELKDHWPIDRFLTQLLSCQLKPAGRNRMKTLCCLPGHREHTPSMVVYLDQGRAWCYGCNRGGDIFDLTAHFFALSSFRDQVEKLAEETISWTGAAA